MDTVTSARRSQIMAAIRSRDTSPEVAVRRYLHAAGLRYRLHVRDLPGRPDIVFRSRRICIFVHGCFWHGCPRCIDGSWVPVKSNTRYWTAKIAGNKQRDRRHRQALSALGWTVLEIWECDLRDAAVLKKLCELVRRVEPGAD